ncbi:hypothetical protein [Tepidibacter mesophilus]|nr:hypothetical protein [Tepidibacter mesophilus]
MLIFHIYFVCGDTVAGSMSNTAVCDTIYCQRGSYKNIIGILGVLG